ncbi:Hypothetical Protein FCC1311_068702 [Hondaea fermentalgiana]|uniref:Uncharacterized protein n=1 Tax=Hondaea fermentalgiana TaxID=2315210 RepID=A0A2R5GIC8_9STRA|nr:Hypothetical Protein FCC1311_068702 [Hondaea fermentalgiana]|eukprot:GBG30650.1 Hypothetical Protein FCC1311_068702 [Hondaea fermentalgiana]
MPEASKEHGASAGKVSRTSLLHRSALHGVARHWTALDGSAWLGTTAAGVADGFEDSDRALDLPQSAA